MISEQKIIETLRRIGFTESEIPGIMQDVGRLILAKLFETYFEALPEGERARMSSMQPEELPAYFAAHPETLSLITQDRFDAIQDEMWQEYFRSVR